MEFAIGDYNNDGFEDLFLTYYGQNRLYRNNGDGTFTDVTAKAGLLYPRTHFRIRLHVCGLQPRRVARSFCFELCGIDLATAPRAFTGRARTVTMKACRPTAAQTAWSHLLTSFTEITGMELHRCVEGVRHRRSLRDRTDSRRWLLTPMRTAGRISSWPATPRRQLSIVEQPRRHFP